MSPKNREIIYATDVPFPSKLEVLFVEIYKYDHIVYPMPDFIWTPCRSIRYPRLDASEMNSNEMIRWISLAPNVQFLEFSFLDV